MTRRRLFLPPGIVIAMCAMQPSVAQPPATEFSAQSTSEHVVFGPNIESIQQYRCPEWIRGAKLGIYLHGSVYSVPEFGEWHPRNMYIEGSETYACHVKIYGHPSEFGYKDPIPTWRADNWNPDELLTLFHPAGAKYFGPCAVDYDDIDLCDSKHQPCDSVNMGPKKDIIRVWRDSAKNAGLRFGVTPHPSRTYSWFNTANQSDSEVPQKGVPYDVAAGAAPGLHPSNGGGSTNRNAPNDAPPDWRAHWKQRITQLTDDYEPEPVL